jgi:glycosyltransferase 2 family protein
MPSWVPPVLGYSLSAICLIWVLRGYDLHQLASDFRTLDWRWMLLAVAADLAVYVCHGWRWNTLLAPVSRLNFWRTVQAIYIGLFANEVLPLRPGELIRCYLLAYWNGLRVSVGFASAALERIIDGFWMLLAFVIIILRSDKHINREIVVLVQVMAAVLVAATAGLFWIARHKQHAHAVLRESRWSAMLRHVVEGLQLMGNPRTLQYTSAISLLYFGLQVLTMWALMKAYSLDYSIWVAGGVLTLYRLGTVIPNGPGNFGLGNVACFFALTFFELGESEAKTFSFLYLAAQTLPLLAGGAIATAMTGLNIGALREQARLGSVQSASAATDPRI